MIPIEKEPKEFYNEFKCYEKCYFCKEETKFWAKQKNRPVCTECAKKYTVGDLK